MSTQLYLNRNKPHPASSASVSISNLLKGKCYAWISHASETYLLQLTKSNKLLLTK